MTQPLQVELWLDISCPWCYLGRHRLDRAIEAAAAEHPVELVLRSFQLDPGLSTKQPVPEYLAQMFAGTVERGRAADQEVAALAAADGLPYTTDRSVANTFDVHRALHLARAHGVANRLFWDLQRGYFGGELDPFDTDTLVRTAAAAGVPADEARTALTGDAYADQVRRELAAGRALGITGVPFVGLGDGYGVTGLQSVDGYLAAIRTALARRPDPVAT
ncbi:MAG TPA: DsbA family oxidoreductase [Natronosporangium sp.]